MSILHRKNAICMEKMLSGREKCIPHGKNALINRQCPFYMEKMHFPSGNVHSYGKNCDFQFDMSILSGKIAFFTWICPFSAEKMHSLIEYVYSQPENCIFYLDMSIPDGRIAIFNWICPFQMEELRFVLKKSVLNRKNAIFAKKNNLVVQFAFDVKNYFLNFNFLS